MNVVVRLVIILALFLSGCAAVQTVNEHITFEEPGWKIGHHAEVPGQYTITEFINEKDDINNWKELATIQVFSSSWGGDSPEDAFNKVKALREKECPGVTTWNVIAKDETSILYEWQAKPCLGWPDQHEIAKILFGKNNRFVLHYAAKVRQLAPNIRTKWVSKLTKTTVEIGQAPAGLTTFEAVEVMTTKLANERVVPGYAGEAHSGDMQRTARDLVLRADSKDSPNCNSREVVNTFRAAPAILEEGTRRSWIHLLERWEIRRCGQSVMYYVWYTFNSFSDGVRVIVLPASKLQETEDKEPAFKVLRQYEAKTNRN